MIILPAIDLKEGRCVRLEQALMWQEQGGEYLHIIKDDGQ